MDSIILPPTSVHENQDEAPLDDELDTLGYTLRIPEYGGGSIVFLDYADLSDYLESEAEELAHDEATTFIIGRMWTSKAAIEAMPEFDGW